MQPISDLTYKIIAFHEFPAAKADEYIDWALEMVFNGHESPALFMLAGLSRTTNLFEATEHLQQSLKELNLKPKWGRKAFFSYCSYFIKKMAQSEDVRNNLRIVHQVCSGDNFKLAHELYLLYWAWGDLEAGIYPQQYWPDANIQSIESIVVSEAKKWLQKNEREYLLRWDQH
ncbi:MAG: hypothetical protein WCF67_02120 [Chitinophagaceae bacterium]